MSLTWSECVHTSSAPGSAGGWVDWDAGEVERSWSWTEGVGQEPEEPVPRYDMTPSCLYYAFWCGFQCSVH